MQRFAMILMALLVFAAGSASAHSGGKDKNGCHHDRRNGTYHCH
jgi:hypothetical protein